MNGFYPLSRRFFAGIKFYFFYQLLNQQLFVGVVHYIEKHTEGLEDRVDLLLGLVGFNDFLHLSLGFLNLRLNIHHVLQSLFKPLVEPLLHQVCGFG